jgi:FMN phosphatase YigB (HAD superfamily)
MKKITVSFDFDGTLSDQFFGDINSEGEDVKELFRSLANSEEFEVLVITRRFGPENSQEGLGDEHVAVYELIEKLKSDFPKEKIVFTNRKYKFSFINNLGVDIHFDDDPQEHYLIRQYSNGSSVDVQQPGWKMKFEELLQK